MTFNLKQQILSSRDIKEKSLDTYLTMLKKLNNKQDIESLDFLSNFDNIKINMEKLADTTKRNYLCAVMVALDSRPENLNNDPIMLHYKQLHTDITLKYDKFIKSHIKTPQQKENWFNQSDLLDVIKKYNKQIRAEKFKKKTELTQMELNFLVSNVICNLYTYIPVVRLDYAPMKIIFDIKKDDDKTNFLYIQSRNKKKFIINEYKTAEKYGKKIIDIPTPVNSAINLLRTFYKNNDSFLINTRGGELTSNGLCKLIPSSFGRFTDKHITLNLLRHCLITEKIELTEDTKEAKLADAMCHSVSTQQDYIKIDQD